jgi:hypothetical protein
MPVANPNDGSPRPRHRLDQNVLPFAVEFGRQQTDSHDVATRAGEVTSPFVTMSSLMPTVR